MADIEIERNHGLGLQEARAKAKQLLAKAKEQAPIDIDYDYVEGDTQDVATANQMGVDVKAMLDAEKIRFEVKLGFLAKSMKGKIKEGLEKGLDKYLPNA